VHIQDTTAEKAHVHLSCLNDNLPGLFGLPIDDSPFKTEAIMIITSGLLSQFPSSTANALAHYRHRVFIERLCWQLPCSDGLESDQFDRADTLYVLARDDAGAIHGCARLLPTVRPYLLGTVFPELLDGLPAPVSPRVWEISRFASSSPSVTRSLLAATVERAAREGATRLLTMSPLGVERLLRRMGVHAQRAGAPVLMQGKKVFACSIEIDAQTCFALELDYRATLRDNASSEAIELHEGEICDA
jgi:acyl homoserine lactone synthase